jgi:glutamate--cysteine ligase
VGAGRLSRERLLDYFLAGAKPRERWKVGMEIERLGRRRGDGRPLPYDGSGPTIRGLLEWMHERRGGEPVLEDGRIIGISARWGEISLEPGGQFEWSSVPYPTLAELEASMREHLGAMREAARALDLEWLDVAVDPVHPVSEMPWMPKLRYRIMHDHLRGRLAHRMMTQTASIQCAYDYADATDWNRKFRAAAILAPVATAMFANSSRVDGRDSGYRSYRQAIWRETDDARCGLPAIVFEAGFTMERWIDWLLAVPLLFRRTPDGLLPPDGSSFSQLLAGPESARLEMPDWDMHCSTIFTEVRCYTYMEVRSADVQPDELAFSVPAYWTGTLYDESALEMALAIGEGLDHATWMSAMDSAARSGLDGRLGRHGLRELAARTLTAAARALRDGVPCAAGPAGTRDLEALGARLGLDVRV